jgi:hypothetical protein
MDDVEYIEVEWEDRDHFIGTFELKPETTTFKVKYPILERGQNSRVQAQIELQYLPVIVNHAATGHKLQLKIVESLVIAECVDQTVSNWFVGTMQDPFLIIVGTLVL